MPITPVLLEKTKTGKYVDLLGFIAERWDDTVRETKADNGQLIGLPKPYTVPCRREHFQQIYYWDTFYTNEGLLAQGRLDLARGNVDNLLYLAERFGFVPNGNATYFLGRSQPPHLALMVDRIFETSHDLDWLRSALPALEKEQAFWRERRTTALGLAHYGTHASDEELLEVWAQPDERGVRPPEPAERSGKIREAAHMHAICESGWDFCPRFDRRTLDFFPVDLNALLWASERMLEKAHLLLGDATAALRWREAADKRTAFMRKFLWSSELGAFVDYDYVNGRQSALVSAAMFYPVWMGLCDASETESIMRLLPRLERNHGILACEPGPRDIHYQWDAPNAWPPLQYAAVQALIVAGRRQDATRVAKAFLDTVVINFDRTGDLWEKYNADTGDLNVTNEYGLPAMMGWTAGVSVALATMLEAP